jgi:hypothetical protein
VSVEDDQLSYEEVLRAIQALEGEMVGVDIDKMGVGETPGFPIAHLGGILYASAPAPLDPGQEDKRACWDIFLFW